MLDNAPFQSRTNMSNDPSSELPLQLTEPADEFGISMDFVLYYLETYRQWQYLKATTAYFTA